MAADHRGLHFSRRRFVHGASMAGLGLLMGCQPRPGQMRRAEARVPRVGYLGPPVPSEGGEVDYQRDGFLQGLQELGYITGQNILIEYRKADGTDELLAALAADLVNSDVDVIVTVGNLSATAAKRLTSRIPIVNISFADPVSAGLVPSLARPGGNLTGMSADTGRELAGKRLDLLKQAVPATSRVAVLWSPEDAARNERFAYTQDAARTFGISVQPVPVRVTEDFDSAFAAVVRDGAEAMVGLGSPLLFAHRRRVADFALRQGLPSIQTRREFADGGGLMAYGPSFADLARRSATYVDKILKGASPADLPVEQPTTFDFVINLRTAAALGVTIPPHVLLQATEVIQ
jgi:putative tryptophan/tyrosine transport system substrate-binding protein